MTIDVSEVDAFPSPFSIETPVGCEGWGEMYPPWALFEERLITQRFSLDQAPEALKWAMGHPAETMKVVIELGGEGS
jgi:hypothetical protein